MINHVTIFIFLLSSSSLFSQGEASHWYFGNGAGLIFDTNTDTVSPTSAASSTINTNEGCSSISDSNGNLLFYTDGRNVWDKNHQIMPNADYNNGSGLLGDPSSTSSGLIIPRPGNPGNYYIFTVDEPHHNNAWAYPNQGPSDVNGNAISQYDDNGGNGGNVPNGDDGFNNGLNYSLVDLTLNGGNGDVVSTEKNRPLLTYDPLDQEQASFKCSEKITAVEHDDRQSYWVISHFLDVFYSFRVDASGVNATPITTQINPLITLNGYRRNSIGYLKSSPDGTKLAICHNEEGTTQGQGSNSTTGSFWLYDFDDATGIVSNPMNLGSNSGFYGTAFSTDSSKLYASAGSFVYQFDLDATDITGSQQTVRQGGNSIFALQLAPNGKIYGASLASNGTSLDVINNPDELGTLCNYVEGGQALAPGTDANLGLPPFIQSFFLAKIEVDNLCLGSATQFSIDSNENFDSIQWDFGDSSAMNTIDSPTHVYPNTGSFTVTATLTLGAEVNTFSETIEIYEVPTAFSPNDILECDDNNDGVIAVNLNQTVDTEIFNGQSPLDYTIKYYESQVNADTDMGALAMPYQNISNPQTLFARIENNSNQACFDTTSFLLTVFELPQIVVEEELIYCLNTFPSVITLDGGILNGFPSGFFYNWSTGAATPQIQVNTVGTYTVTVSDTNGCFKLRTITVLPSNTATFESIEIVDGIENNTVTIFVSGEGDYEYALDSEFTDFQNSNVFSGVKPGFHTVYVRDKNDCGTVKKNISVIGFPKFFTPNGDGYNDSWHVYGINTPNQANSEVYIFDRFGKLLIQLNPLGTGWDGTYNGAIMPTSDYWFYVKLEDGRLFKGHFTLKT